MHHSKSTENRAKLQKRITHKIVRHNVLSPLLFLISPQNIPKTGRF